MIIFKASAGFSDQGQGRRTMASRREDLWPSMRAKPMAWRAAAIGPRWAVMPMGAWAENLESWKKVSTLLNLSFEFDEFLQISV